MVYTTVKEVVETAGTYKGIYDLEAVGTGNTVETSFSLDNNPVVEGSEVIYVDGTATTAFTMNYLTGVITFTAAPAAVAITATYLYFEGVTMDSDVVTEKIADADAWLNEFTGRVWEPTDVNDVVLDGTGTDTMFIRPDHTPLITLDALEIDGTTITPSSVYVYGNVGKLLLGEDSEESTFRDNDPQNVTVSYTHGYATTPQKIKKLAKNIAALDVIFSVMGGTFDDITSGKIDDLEFAVGEPYTNLRATAIELKTSTERMLKNIKKRPVIY